MVKRKIVEIDEQRCTGCGDCIPNCPEGALQIVDGKARIVQDRYCDGLGACLGVCPEDAIRIVGREADQFDEEAVAEHLARAQEPGPVEAPAHADLHGAGCPGAAMMDLSRPAQGHASARPTGQASALSQWPVQLWLVPVRAPYFEGADLLLAADCVPFAYADFHAALLSGRRLLVGCPKLDDAEQYAEKLAAILTQNEIRSLTVAHMEVPCCFGLVALAQHALAHSGKDIPVEEVTIGIGGDVQSRQALEAGGAADSAG